jgi:hypothetical protein
LDSTTTTAGFTREVVAPIARKKFQIPGFIVSNKSNNRHSNDSALEHKTTVYVSNYCKSSNVTQRASVVHIYRSSCSNFLRFFFAGRRARTVVQAPAPTLNPSIRLTNGLDPDHSCDSPKRKDSKIENDTVTNESALQKLQNGLRNKATQPASQRTRNNVGASTATGSQPITNYFNNIEKKFTNVTINEKTKDKPDKAMATTDENACDGGRLMRTRKQKAPSKLTSPCLQSNNIFLQEPVTTLNIDKTETQSASIVLKNSFLENGFSKLLTTGLGSFNGPLYTRYSDDIDIEYVESTSSSGSEKELDKALDLTKPTQVTVIDSTTTTILINENSNDSGVVVSDGGGSSSSGGSGGGQLDLSMTACSPNRRRKPATPHRILCPSPVKTVCAELQPTAMMAAHATVKSQNAKNAKIPKSRRKLEKKLLEEEKAKPIAYTITAAVQPFKEPVVSKTVVSRHTTDQQLKIDSFYPAVRKSVRKTKKEVEDERTRFIERAIRDGRDEGLAVSSLKLLIDSINRLEVLNL